MKLFLYIISLICIAFSEIQASEKTSESAVVPKYQLSTHILDTNLGRPASNVSIVLFRLAEDGETWNKVDEGITDSNGRIASFLSAQRENDGIYKLKFETKDYFRKQNLDSIYPFIEVIFEIKGTSHYHIPITMSANGYGTYRGN